MLALGLRGNGRLIEPGFWKRRFQIGNAVLMGKAKTHLVGVAAHRAHQRIDRGVECVPLFPWGHDPGDVAGDNHFEAPVVLFADATFSSARYSA